MPTQCYINFDHSDGVYYSGETLKGDIQLITHAPKTIRGVHITINGYANVKIEGKNVTYYAHDQFIDSRTYVAGQMNGASFEFAPSVYDYTFCCELVSSLPSSVSGTWGEIKYEVILTIDRPFRFDNVFKREFTVIRELNLNFFPIFWQPRENIIEKKIYTVCCYGNSGIIKTKLRIPISAYASRQQINFVLEVTNESTNDLGQCEVKLNQCIAFETRQPQVIQKHDKIILGRKNFPEVLRNSYKKFEDSIIIPCVPPSSNLLYDSRSVRVNYVLHATIKTGFFHKCIKIEIPVIIGTIPLTMTTTNDESITIEQPPIPRNACLI